MKISEVQAARSQAMQDTGPEFAFDLPALLGIVRARARIIVGTTLIVLTLSALLVFFVLQPKYTASAVVMIDKQKNQVFDVESVLSGITTDAVSIQNQLQILNSQSLLVRAAKKLGLDKTLPIMGGDQAPAQSKGLLNLWGLLGSSSVSMLTEAEKAARREQMLANGLRGGLSVSVRGTSSALQISYESPDRQEAARRANAIAEAYVEDQLNAKFEATQQATVWLADRLQELSGQVQASEAAVQQYKAENNITETSEGTSIIEEQLAQINGQLVIARSQLAEQEARYAQVASLQRSGRATDMAEVVASPLLAQLRVQEAEIERQEAELTTRYGPRHPKLLDLASQKTNLQAKIRDEVGRVVQSVGSDVAVARARVNSLQGSLNSLRADTGGENKARIKLAELEAAASSNRALYEAFLTRFKKTESQEDIQTPDARIISQAQVPAAPSYPNKMRGLAVGALSGLFLGFLFALMAERLDAGFRTVKQVEQTLRLPVLATLPELKGKTIPATAADLVIDKPTSVFAESIRGLDMGLTVANVDKRPKVVLVTSSVPEEGKTTVAISLARHAVRSGKRVILIDGDLRRRNIANTLGLTGIKNGIVEAIIGSAPFESCITRDPRSELTILPAVKSSTNAPDLLASEAMANFVRGLREHYDLVIIDSAPLLPVNDTKVILRMVDSIIFVIRWERTARDAALAAVRTMNDFNGPIAGIALTRADTARYHYYSYGYYGYGAYNKYYNA
jgi:capsular exopolysaccharide synthesis family protein